MQRNFEKIKNYAPGCKIIAVIKADAYGHGLIRVLPALTHADALAVATLGEARELRAAAWNGRILVLEGCYQANDLADVHALSLDIVIHQKEQLLAIKELAGPPRIPVWLKIDSGMHRLGFPIADTESILGELSRCQSVLPPIRLMTHLASADERNNAHTQAQIDAFSAVTEPLAYERTVANSAAIMAWPQSHCQWVRAGIMLYGISPFVDSTGPMDGLEPVMSLETQLIAIQQLKKGDTVGYGASYVCPQDMLVGVGAIGYGDGYPWYAQTGTPVLLKGKLTHVLGRVSMDMISIDLTGHDAAKIGDTLVLWGKGLPVETVAKSAGTIPYGLICGITRRVEFVVE